MGLQLHPDVVSVGVDLQTPEDQLAAAIAHIAQLRWQSSQQFTLNVPPGSQLAPVNGYLVANTTDARINVLGAISDLAPQASDATRRWKFADDNHPTVWLDLTGDALSELGRAMAVSQQAAYDREEELTKILNGSGDPNSVDVMTGWPS